MIKFNTFAEAQTAFRARFGDLEEAGVSWAGTPPVAFTPEPWKRNSGLAMDALTPLSTDPNSGVPALLTTLIDPTMIEVLFSPTKAAVIFGEVQKGNWLSETDLFPVAEHTGEVSSYGDYNNNGAAGVNTNWPTYQAYLFQVVKEYGERELERAGLGKINWVGEIDKAAAGTLNRFANIAYFLGIAGLQNYGFLNDPALAASITPAPKAAGGTQWIVGGKINAQANEVYADIEALYYQLVSQAGGNIAQDTAMTLALSPGSAVALTATNTFNVNVTDLLKKNFPKMRVETAVQYGSITAQNPQGIAAGNMVQLIADDVEGQDTGFCAFNVKQRAHPIIREMSAFKQKVTSGVWGAIVRMPFAIGSMIGV